MPFINVVVSAAPDAALARALAEGVTERTTRVLHKDYAVAAVTVSFVSPALWFVGGRSLEEHGLSSFWLDCKVTRGTNTEAEKAAFLAEIFTFMRERLGPLHEESYALVDEASADAYGYGGLTQAERRRRAAAAE